MRDILVTKPRADRNREIVDTLNAWYDGAMIHADPRLIRLERRHFVELAQQDKTQARIAHMLKTGKPLRN